MMMQPYEGLAEVYDYLMSGVDYEEWADYVEEILYHFNVEPQSRILDVACGTGSSTIPWAERGYSACGVDVSADMLQAAERKAAEKGVDAAFYNQDMRSLKLPFTVDVALLYQDGLNYLLREEDVKKAFDSISSVLRPGGFFIFNLNLVDKLPASAEPQVYWVEEEEITLVWESFIQHLPPIWHIKLAAFIRRGDGLYHKVTEEHKERSYTRREIESLLRGCRFSTAACYRAFTFSQPAPGDRNIFYVLRREG